MDSALAIPLCPVVVEYAAPALEEIRLAVMDAFFKIPRGGLEIGGVLFGQRTEASVWIESCRMLPSDYASGPSFTLSEDDHARLRELLAIAIAEGLLPVGWFRSRTRSELQLADADITMCETYFPEPWQVALVLRPEVARPMRAGFFARLDGSYSCLGEFGLEPWSMPRASAVELPIACAPQDLKFLSAAAAPRSHSRALWIAAMCLGLAAAAVGAREYLDRTQERISLEAFDRDGQLQLSWDQSARAVRAASRAELEITDGDAHLSTSLAAPQLQRGSFYYARRTERVDVHLSMIDASGRSTEEYASFVGRLVPLSNNVCAQ